MKEYAPRKPMPVVETIELGENEIRQPSPSPEVSKLMYLRQFISGESVDENAIQTLTKKSETAVDFFTGFQAFVNRILRADVRKQAATEGIKNASQSILETQVAIVNWLQSVDIGKLPTDPEVRDRNQMLDLLAIDRTRLNRRKTSANKDTRKTDGGELQLYAGLKSFQENYLDQKDIVKFITKIADSCRKSPDNSVDVQQLASRLHAVSPLINAFVPDSITSLVESYCLYYGFMAQKDPRKKEAVAREAAISFEQRIIDPEKETALLAFRDDQLQRQPLKIPARSEKKAMSVQEAVANAEKEAREEHFTTTIADKMRDRQDRVISNYLHDKEKTSAYLTSGLSHITESKMASIEVETESDLRTALNLLHAKNIDEIVEHEAAHFTEAKKQGCSKVRFKIQVAIDDVGRVVVYPATSYWFARGTSESARREKMERIIKAPETAGLASSLHDRKQLVA